MTLPQLPDYENLVHTNSTSSTSAQDNNDSSLAMYPEAMSLDEELDEDNQLPPGYAAGSTIEVAPTVKSLYNPVVRVFVESTSPMVDVNQTLIGKVLISPKCDLTFSRLVVDIVGEEISQRLQGLNQVRYTRRFQLAQYIVPPSLFPEQNIVRDALQYTVSFSITIPNHLLTESDCRCQDDALSRSLHMQLPPAYGSSIELNVNAKDDIADLSAKVVYKVRARLYKPIVEGQTTMSWHAQSTRMIPLRPSVYPPVDASMLIDDTGKPLLKPVYSTEASVTSSSHLFSRPKKLGTMQMSVHRPITMFLLQQNTNSVHVNLRYIRDINNSSSDMCPPQILSVAYSVTELTYSSTKAMGYPPSKHSMAAQKDQKRKSLHCYSTRVARQKLTIASPQWELFKDNGCNEASSHVGTSESVAAPPIFQTHLTIPLLCLDQQSVPTYFSCLTSRQYELTLTIFFKGSPNKMELQVPILVTNYSFPDTDSVVFMPYNNYAASSKTSFSTSQFPVSESNVSVYRD